MQRNQYKEQQKKNQQHLAQIEGDYRIVKKIGEGTYGTVYSAVCQRNAMPVAIKKVKIRKVEEGLPKELVREVESIEAIASNYDLKENFIVSIIEVYLGKTSLNIVYQPLCPKLDLQSFLSSKNALDKQVMDKLVQKIKTDDNWPDYNSSIQKYFEIEQIITIFVNLIRVD